MEATTENGVTLSPHIKAVDSTNDARLILDNLRSSMCGLAERLEDVQGPWEAELRTYIEALSQGIEEVDKAHEAANALHEAHR